jgi:hypothetical protein
MVFLSHASEDRAIAEQVCAEIESRGVKCWMAPRDIPAGTDYAASIIRALNACRAMVLLFSPKSNGSAHVVREVERAANHGAPIVPFRLADVAPSDSLEYFLSSQQWLNAFPGPIGPRIAALADAVANLDALKQGGGGPSGPSGGAARAVSTGQSGVGRSKAIPIAIAAVLAVVVAGVVLYFALRGGTQAPSSPPPAPSPAVAPQAPVEAVTPPNPTPVAQAVPVGETEPAADAIRLSVAATPAEAKIFVDGVEAPSNPVSLRFRKDGLTHTLRLTAPGFAEKTRMVEFNGDITLDIALAASPVEQQPAASDGGDAPRTVRSSTRDAAATVRPPSTEPDAAPAEAAAPQPGGFREVDLPPTRPAEQPVRPVEDNPYRDGQ